MVEKINIEKFLELKSSCAVFDVRSPAEFNHAHFPGAINLPLFSDEERKIVGTTYKQKSREEAIKIGLDFFAPKMRKMVEGVEKIVRSSSGESGETDSRLTTNDSRLLVYCWRGGMRSSAVAWLLDVYGFKVYTLSGGYKKFRNYVLDSFRLPYQFKILGGYTGSGKTELLQALEKNGQAVVNLESIAGHKGSAFGNLGLPKQPTQEMFENLLALELRKKVKSEVSEPVKIQNNGLMTTDLLTSPIWLEDESQRIGDVNIPHDLWKAMRSSPVFFLEIPFEERLNYIVEGYGKFERENLLSCITRIEKRLGGLEAKKAIAYLEEDNFIECFRILLKYYDRWYFKSLHNRESLNSLLTIISHEKIEPQNAELVLRNIQYQPKTVSA